jgi:hypothetical protein
MLYAEICPKVRRHNARPLYVPRLEGIMHDPKGRLEGIMHDPKGSALCLLTMGHISAYNMDNTILLLLLL